MWKQKWPTGVRKVVRFLLLASNGICQNLSLTLKNAVAPESFGAVFSTVGRINIFHFTALFSLVRSTRILCFLFFLITGIIGGHQSMASFISSLVPKDCILLCSSSTLGRVGKGVHHGVAILYGLTSGWNSIFSGWQLKSPKISSIDSRPSTLHTSHILVVVFHPDKLVVNAAFITYIQKVYFRPCHNSPHQMLKL